MDHVRNLRNAEPDREHAYIVRSTNNQTNSRVPPQEAAEKLRQLQKARKRKDETEGRKEQINKSAQTHSKQSSEEGRKTAQNMVDMRPRV